MKKNSGTEAAASSSVIPLHDLNPIFIPAAIKATLETLEIQCFTKATAGAPQLKSSNPDALDAAIAAVIGVSGESAKGAISLGFPEKVFLGLMGKMFSENFTTLNAELETGAGEILNIIYGSVKTNLSKEGYQLSPSIPSVICGTKVRVTHLVPAPCSIIQFKTEFGVFKLEIGIVRPR